MTEIVPLPDVTAVSIDAKLHGGALSIGNFDGVHRGHAHLLGQTRRVAESVGGPAIACLFDPHPISILRPDLAPKRLTSVTERARRMSGLGIDYLVVCETSPEMLNLTAEAFFDALVRNNLRCGGLVEGENFCFGKDRRGDIGLLTRLCEQHGIRFRIAEMASIDGDMISSTRIRDLLAEGDVASAAKMMGTPHRMDGIVESGDGRGRQIGFPTANLAKIDVVIPAAGVYAGIASVGGARHYAAIHIGESPTFGSGASSKVEVHLFEFCDDLYGQSLSVELIDGLRGVIRFDSAESLIAQLKKDVASARQLLDQYQKSESR